MFNANTMTKYHVLNLAVSGGYLGVVYALTSMAAHDKAKAIWPRHSIAVIEITD